MKIIKPNIPIILDQVENLVSYSIDFREQDMELEGMKVEDNYCEKQDLYKISISGSIFENSKFIDCDFEKSSFVDVVFIKCDFSNSNFKGTYFHKCEFISCKCLGIDMCESILKQIVIHDSNFQYTNFSKADFNGVQIVNSDLSNASISDCRQKNFDIDNTQFINTSFFNTMLKKVDFTNCQIASLVFSDNLMELRGAIISEYQATEIVKLLGVVVK